LRLLQGFRYIVSLFCAIAFTLIFVLKLWNKKNYCSISLIFNNYSCLELKFKAIERAALVIISIKFKLCNCFYTNFCIETSEQKNLLQHNFDVQQLFRVVQSRKIVYYPEVSGLTGRKILIYCRWLQPTEIKKIWEDGRNMD